jgi:hypothetical protein
MRGFELGVALGSGRARHILPLGVRSQEVGEVTIHGEAGTAAAFGVELAREELPTRHLLEKNPSIGTLLSG